MYAFVLQSFSVLYSSPLLNQHYLFNLSTLDDHLGCLKLENIISSTLVICLIYIHIYYICIIQINVYYSMYIYLSYVNVHRFIF